MTTRSPRWDTERRTGARVLHPPPRSRPPQPQTPPSETSGSATERASRRRALAAAFALVAAGHSRGAAAAPPGCDLDPPAPVDVAAVLEQARGLYGTGRLEEAEAVLVTAISLVSGCVAVGAPAPLSALEPAAAASASPLLKLLGDVRVDAFRYDDAVDAYGAAIDAGGASTGGALFGRANAFEGKALTASRGGDADAADAAYAAAVRDYTACLALDAAPVSGGETLTRASEPAPSTASIVTFERAQALRALRRWPEARADYERASTLFLAGKDKKRADIAAAQAAFAAFEEGDVAYATRALETLARRLYSSDVRAALAAAYYRGGDAARAEDAWLGLCELRDAMCGKYSDAKWLVEYRRWTPGLANAMQDFLAMR